MEKLTEILLDIAYYFIIAVCASVFPIFIGIINWASIGCNCWNAFWGGFVFGGICEVALIVIAACWVFVMNLFD